MPLLSVPRCMLIVALTASTAGAAPGAFVLDREGKRELVYAFASLPIAASSGRTHRLLPANTFLYRGRQVGDFVAFAFHVPTAGNYQVLVSTFDYKGRATVRADVDDQKLDTIDLYAPMAYLHPPRPVGRLRLDRGKHTVTLRVTGHHAKSSNYNIALDELRLRPSQRGDPQ